MNPPSVRELLSAQARVRAKRALNAGELASAMRGAVEALIENPFDTEAFALIDEIIRHARDPLALAPFEPGRAGLVLAVARVRVLFNVGRPQDALELCCALLSLAPADALFQIMKQAITPQLIGTLGLGSLRNTARALVQYASVFPAPAEPDDPRLSQIEAAAAVLTCMREELPDAAEFYSAEVTIRRRLADPQSALTVALLGVQRFSDDWGCLRALANALADSGSPEEGLLYARRALALRPHDGAPLHDAAMAFLALNRPTAAAQILEELIERFPDYPRAERDLAAALARATLKPKVSAATRRIAP